MIYNANSFEKSLNVYATVYIQVVHIIQVK